MKSLIRSLVCVACVVASHETIGAQGAAGDRKALRQPSPSSKTAASSSEPRTGIPAAGTRRAFPLPEQYKRPPSRGFLDQRYVKEEGRQHVGIDLPAPAGTPVYATAPGRVVSNNTKSAPAQESRLILQQEGTRTQSVYGHVYSTTTPQTRVKPGQYIGEIKDQGRNSHLHYGENQNGIPMRGWGRQPAATTPAQIGKQGWADPAKRLYGR